MDGVKEITAGGRPVYEANGLVQRLNFPHAATRLLCTEEGDHILAAGLHPPQIACFQLDQLTEKWRRHLDADVISMEAVASDWSKLALLTEPRTVALHSKRGAHYSLRVPKHGRSMCYSSDTATLAVGCSSSEVYRLSLEQGRFLRPIGVEDPEGVSSLAVSRAHGLIAAGGATGELDLIDPRLPKRLAHLPGGAGDCAVTSLAHHADGIRLAAGLATGEVKVYDLRSPHAVVSTQHRHGSEVKRVQFLGRPSGGDAGSELAVSCDGKGFRAWRLESGSTFLAFDSAAGVNDMLVYPNSGLLMTAEESGNVPTRHIPDLGPAPRWCTGVESLPEEAAKEASGAEHEDFRFVTREELGRLGLSHLQGTSLLKPHMHGFFLHAKLYHRALAVADPDPARTARRERLERKMKEQKESRITIPKRLPKVNKAFASKLEGSKQESLLRDERFSRMFQDEEFAIDPSSRDYQLLHPFSSRAASKRQRIEEEDEDAEPQPPAMFEAKGEPTQTAEENVPLSKRVAKEEQRPSGPSHPSPFGNKEASFEPRSSGKRRRR